MRNLIALILAFACLVPIAFADGSQNAVDNYFGNLDEKPVYTDLSQVEWAREAINYLADYGVIHDDNGAVNPKRYVTRQEFTELIVGAFGVYDSTAECRFTDVSKSSFYYPYIASAYRLGIINGISEIEFGTQQLLSRQDMATIIFRMGEKCGVIFDEKAELGFGDADQIDVYAKDAVSALVGAGAVSGDENYNFLPKNPSTFAEACKIVYYLMLKNT